ncbi:hypothetical protein NPIL_567411 [Nephila pilipes]|uniref:Uncharacterized protein n=1 Tax=Nephila pilipes TaxID=299642 RepID=A0A8X6MJ82_NEPPI|nr:hypothetical protein NPIL_567411 [Nephila pilipes]
MERLIPITNRDLESFANHLFSSCLHQFRMMDYPVFDSPFTYPSIKRAVVSIQYHMRDPLKNCFHHCMDAFEGKTSDQIGIEKIGQLLATMQPYYDGDIFNFTLSNFAVIIELILYMRHVDLTVPLSWFVQSWIFLYRHRIERKLEEKGGWKRLVQTASVRYASTGVYEDLIEDVNRLRYPYQSFNLSMEGQLNRHRVIPAAPMRMPSITDYEISSYVMKMIYARNPILGRPQIWTDLRRDEFLRRRRQEQEIQERQRHEQERQEHERQAAILEYARPLQVALEPEQPPEQQEDEDEYRTVYFWC